MIWNIDGVLSTVTRGCLGFEFRHTNAGTVDVDYTLQCVVMLNRSEVAQTRMCVTAFCAYSKDDLFYPPQLLA